MIVIIIIMLIIITCSSNYTINRRTTDRRYIFMHASICICTEWKCHNRAAVQPSGPRYRGTHFILILSIVSDMSRATLRRRVQHSRVSRAVASRRICGARWTRLSLKECIQCCKRKEKTSSIVSIYFRFRSFKKCPFIFPYTDTSTKIKTRFTYGRYRYKIVNLYS